MSLGEPVDSILLKTKRAHKHVLDLETAYRTFGTTEPYPYTVAFETDPNTGDRLYSLSKVAPIPQDFALLIGDAINNIRSCLDHAVYALVKVANRNAIKRRDAKFIIGDSPGDFKTKFERVKPGLREDAIKAIEGIQPYIGGAGEYLCHINGLANIDKHRLLLTIWGSCEAHSILPSQRQWVADFQGKDPAVFEGAFMGHRISPLKVGDILLRVPKAEVEENMEFRLNIAFAEPQICKGNPVIESLHQMREVVSQIVVDFWRFGLFR